MCVCVQVWNYNLVVDSFMGQMVVPVPQDGDSHRHTERYIVSCDSNNNYTPHLL